MLGDVLGQSKPDDKDDNAAGVPQPTGTFREHENAKDDIGWGEIPSSGGRMGAGGPKSRGSKADEDEFDVVENILDDIEEKKGIESTKPRAKTAGIQSDHQKHESLWSAGFGAGKGQNSSRHEVGEDLDELDELDMGGEREKFSGSKQHMNQKSHDQILERKKMLFGG